ncbi:class I SAM-dependent methyltransferase [Desulfovibrio litoralis]|uniref:UbiE/COQ5 methyltransferase family protein n=1 Tax=Desulfovibrio litoralis DSM 11393 TaxID=1121455 RepID=A0A1M7T285_9BACT|nr:class I SAM-dependent methyltransferase [Desulfovibrio litoralis]SHN64777.1 ubiE/COQ5 methyltransferase family protein [Desulfovibrio litoralis DSM 11393]
MKKNTYCCPQKECNHTVLNEVDNELRCGNGHSYMYASGTTIPIFAKADDNINEYTVNDAVEMHDNALNWLFATFNEKEHHLRTRMVNRLQLKKGDTVLVTGAGACNDLPFIVNSLNGSGEIYAQDISEQMLLVGAKRYQENSVSSEIKVFFSVSDATSLPFSDEFFDAAYHFGGINLFDDIELGISEMSRVVKCGGKIVIGDEGLAPWLQKTDIGKMLIQNNALYAFTPPLQFLPRNAQEVKLTWELSNSFYCIEFIVGAEPVVNLDIKHVGLRGGSIRTRYLGQLEGINPELKDKIYAEAAARGISRVDFLESLLYNSLGE